MKLEFTKFNSSVRNDRLISVFVSIDFFDDPILAFFFFKSKTMSTN